MKSEAAAPVVFVVDDVRSLDYPLRVRGREHLHGDSDRWNQICERYPNPHQRACAFLVLKGGQTEELRSGKIEWIDKSITKHKER
jgi:hypothetical protein